MFLLTALFVFVSAVGAVEPIRPNYRQVNYDPAKIAPYTLEDPLTFLSGKKMTSPEQWRARRREILDIFAREMYGQEPPAPECIKIELIEEKEGALAGFAVRSQYRMWFKTDKSGPCLDFLVLRPRFGAKKARPVIFLNYGGNHKLIPDREVVIPEGMWSHAQGHQVSKQRGTQGDPNRDTVLPVGMLLSSGFAVISCCYCQVSPDPLHTEEDPRFRQEPFAYTKIFELWGKRDESRTDNITSLGAWAWALCRGLDLAETVPGLDAKHAVVTGCSRLGKAALLAAARDERFAACVAIQCGGGGAALAKRDFGENIVTETRMFRHWYCKAYDKYAADPAKLLTFDQHLLLAAVAPRKLLVAGFDDPWFDTEGEFLACKAASPVWEFLGRPGLPQASFPADFSASAIGPSLGYYRRSQKHGIAYFDWLQLIRFAGEK
jgi:hypothetical protein